jgi:P27 family predicted phage terminase small subunit
MAPKKKPTALKKLHGTYRADRALENEFTPMVSSSVPLPPHDLNEWGRVEWNRIVPQLIDYGLFTEFDKSMLYSYCNEYGKYVEYETILKEKGRIKKAPSGYPMINPLESMAQRALKNAITIATQFGFTPSSRTGIQAGSGNQFKNPFDLLKKVK